MKKVNIISIILMFSAVVVSYLIFELPDTVPVHINMYGEIDRYSSRYWVLLGPAVSLVCIIGIQLYLRRTFNKHPEALQTVLSIVLCVMAGVCWLPYIIAIQIGLEYINVIIGVFLGLMLIFMGNYMGQLKQNPYVGLKVKWTLINEEVWDKTHRLTGYLMVAGGAIMLIISAISAITGNKPIVVAGLLAVVFFTTVPPICYSYRLYKKIESKSS